jgi:hypothetical protein
LFHLRDTPSEWVERLPAAEATITAPCGSCGPRATEITCLCPAFTPLARAEDVNIVPGQTKGVPRLMKLHSSVALDFLKWPNQVRGHGKIAPYRTSNGDRTENGAPQRVYWPVRSRRLPDSRRTGIDPRRRQASRLACGAFCTFPAQQGTWVKSRCPVPPACLETVEPPLHCEDRDNC